MATGRQVKDADWLWRYHDDPKGESYVSLIKATHKLTNGVCCCCLKNPSEEIHHLKYRGRFDIPGENTVPVCKKCHKISHLPCNWIQDKTNPMRRSHSTLEWEARLKFGIKILRSTT